MDIIEIGGRDGAGEYTYGAQWVYRNGRPVFGAPPDWSPERMADTAVEYGLPRDLVLVATQAFRVGLAARYVTAQKERVAQEKEMAAAARAREAEAVAVAERERTMRARRACSHSAQDSRTVGYTGGSPGTDGDRRAAGGVTHVDTCRCGAVRYTDANGRHSDVGRWLVDAE